MRIPARWVWTALIYLGGLSILIHPDTRRLLVFNFQQIVPAPKGETYYTIWHIPPTPYYKEVMFPFYPRYPGLYRERVGDWRIHAVRACMPGADWGDEYTWHEYEAQTLKELRHAADLNPDEPDLQAAIALDLIRQEDTLALRDEPDPAPPPIDVLREIRARIERMKRLEPDNGTPHLIEARLLFGLERDEEAIGCVAAAVACPKLRHPEKLLLDTATAFLLELGVPDLEARLLGRDVVLDIGDSFLAVSLRVADMAGKAREGGAPPRAVRLLGLSLDLDRIRPPAWPPPLIPPWQLRHLLTNEENQKDRSERVALEYMARHGDEARANRLRSRIEQWRTNGGQEKEEWTFKRTLILIMVSHATLFMSAFALLCVVIFGSAWALLPGPRLEAPPMTPGRESGITAAIVVTSIISSIFGIGASTDYIIHATPHGSEYTTNLMFLLPLLVFLAVAIIGASRTGHTRRSLRRDAYALLVRFVLPRATACFAAIYLLLAWTTVLLREAHPGSF